MKRSWKSMLAVWAAAVVCGLSTKADATAALLLSREELVLRSTVVARVTVGSSSTSESDDGASIVTRTAVKVTRALVGSPGQDVVIEQIGGVYHGKTQRLSGDARLSEGEDAVVFLRRGDKGRFHLTALSLSVYHVDARGLAKRDLGSVVLVKRSGSRAVRVPAYEEQPEPVESLMTDVVRIAGGR